MKKFLLDGKRVSLSFDDLYERYLSSLDYEAFIFTKNYPHLDWKEDDIKQELSIVLYRCFLEYDIGKGLQFSTYFYSSMKHRLLNILDFEHTEKREGRIADVSIDTHFDNDIESSYLNTLESKVSTVDMFFEKHIVQTCFNEAKDELENDIIKYFLGNYTVRELAKKHEVSNQTVYNKIERFRDRLKRVLL